MRIALVSEGTYPFAVGGVSVWCDQLIRGLPQHEWEVVALTVDGTERPLWEAPENLTGVRNLPLWGPHAPLRRPARGGGDRFADPYGRLIAALLRPVTASAEEASADRRLFLGALRELHAVSIYEDLAGPLTSAPALDLLVGEWNALYGDGLSLSDALRVALLLEHMLRPLFAPPVRADVVHASMNGLSMLVAMAAKWHYGTPVILSEHGIYLRERYLDYLGQDAPHSVKVLVLSFFRQLSSAGYLVTDALAPHSNYNRRWQLQGGASPERMWTMYNGVSPDSFPAAAEEPTVPTMVFMGRIDPIKDLHSLIRAFALVVEELPEARLRVFGGSTETTRPYHDSCLKLVADLGLGAGVTFEGPVEDPVQAYHAASVVVLSSISEGFPYTVVEAMACGRAVVCTDVGGVKEAVADTGLVVPPRNSPALAQACLRLLGDEPLRARLATAARQRVMDHFTLDQSLAAYLRLYEGLCSGGVPVEDRPGAARWPQLGDLFTRAADAGDQ